MKKAVKIILLFLVMGILCVPLTQQLFKLLPPDQCKLYGSFEKAQDTSLTLSGWMSGRYQEKTEKFLNENFGYRNLLVKINNQIGFSLFNKINTKNVFKGKKNYLYDKGFYNCYSGTNYKGGAYADSVFRLIKLMNDSLSAVHKKLLVCFAPCKESFYPEYLPDGYKLSETNLYQTYKKRLLQNNIPLLDYQNYFMKLKLTSKYPLFTQGAVHWTSYGAGIALDTFFRRISYEINKKMNLIKIKSVELSDTARGPDDDMARAMNLLYKVNSEKLAYPSFEFIYNQDSCIKPKVFIIGDSFFYGLNNTWLPPQVFSNESYFLYYFQMGISYNPKNPDVAVKDLDFKKELRNTDIVILFFSVGNLDRFPYSAEKMFKSN
jgi:hypothetical protein